MPGSRGTRGREGEGNPNSGTPANLSQPTKSGLKIRVVFPTEGKLLRLRKHFGNNLTSKSPARSLQSYLSFHETCWVIVSFSEAKNLISTREFWILS